MYLQAVSSLLEALPDGKEIFTRRNKDHRFIILIEFRLAANRAGTLSRQHPVTNRTAALFNHFKRRV